MTARTGAARSAARALVVDDDPAVLQLMSRWLDEAGFCVQCETKFSRALHQVQHNPPDVLVTDVRLEGNNGLQLAIWLRERAPKAIAVVISGWDDPVLRRDANNCGAVYLVKPLSAPALLAAIGLAPNQPAA